MSNVQNTMKTAKEHITHLNEMAQNKWELFIK